MIHREVGRDAGQHNVKVGVGYVNKEDFNDDEINQTEFINKCSKAKKHEILATLRKKSGCLSEISNYL